MRNIVLGITLTIIVIVAVSIELTTSGRSVRREEINSLDTAVEGTVETLKKQTYTIDDSDKFAADMLQALITQMDSDCELTVNVLDCNREKGLLSVEAIETFKHPNGKKGTVSSNKTVILENKENVLTDNDQQILTLKYERQTESGNELYKEYKIKKGETFIIPKNPDPDISGTEFKGWLLNGSEFDFMGMNGQPITMTDNITLSAKFE